MKSTFVIGLHEIAISETLGRGFQFSDSLFLTNESAIVRELLPDIFRDSAGMLEYNFLLSAGAVLYSRFEHSDQVETEMGGAEVLSRCLEQTQLLLQSLWFVRDNSANAELGFLVHHIGGYPVPAVTSNMRLTRFSRSDNSVSISIFNRAELREARRYFQSFDPIPRPSSDCAFMLPPTSSRIERSFYFMQAARSASDVGAKVANYVTSLESLFCTDSSEMSHKLGERIASFLSNLPDEKFLLYRTAKSAYNIRSKIVHGDSIKTPIAKITEVSCECDDLLRQIFKKILADSQLFDRFSGPADELEDFLIKLIFGAVRLEDSGAKEDS